LVLSLVLASCGGSRPASNDTASKSSGPHHEGRSADVHQGRRGVLAQDLGALRPVVLPRDHGAHPAFEIEWWYTAGTVADARGRDYFWFATVWSGMGFLLGRVNVVDLRADRIVLAKEYVATGAPGQGQTRMDVGGFGLGWRPSGALGRWSIDAPVPGAGALRLTLTPVQPYVLNGSRGIVAEGPGGFSAYYSAPRLAATGTLVLGGRAIGVSGQGWFDHQWGNFVANQASWHWNWFACQLRDGSDMMLYEFIDPGGRPTGVQSGTFVPRPGVVAQLSRFTVQPLAPAIRPPGATVTYPLRWRLEVPAAHLDLTLAARARQQFIANQYFPGFWEGAAAITSGAPGGCIVESTREPMSTF
jgi:predicted secreted hydrolase